MSPTPERLHDEPAPELAGSSVDPSRLRAWRDADRAPFAAMNADPEVMRHFVTPLTVEQSDAFVDRIVAHQNAHGWGLWALEVDERFAGYVGLWPATFAAPFTPTVEVGWRLARWAWGRGAASTAARRALDAAPALGIAEVVSFTARVNTRSIAVMERIGLRRDPDGDFAHPAVPEDHPLRPHVLFR